MAVGLVGYWVSESDYSWVDPMVAGMVDWLGSGKVAQSDPRKAVEWVEKLVDGSAALLVRYLVAA
jgi:hypothetical protein